MTVFVGDVVSCDAFQLKMICSVVSFLHRLLAL